MTAIVLKAPVQLRGIYSEVLGDKFEELNLSAGVIVKTVEEGIGDSGVFVRA